MMELPWGSSRASGRDHVVTPHPRPGPATCTPQVGWVWGLPPVERPTWAPAVLTLLPKTGAVPRSLRVSDGRWEPTGQAWLRAALCPLRLAQEWHGWGQGRTSLGPGQRLE